MPTGKHLINPVDRICGYQDCSKRFTPSQNKQRYCCTDCRRSAWNVKQAILLMSKYASRAVATGIILAEPEPAPAPASDPATGNTSNFEV